MKPIKKNTENKLNILNCGNNKFKIDLDRAKNNRAYPP